MDLRTFTFVLVLTSCALVAFSQSTTADPGCIQKLMPCQPFLKPPATPPATCCEPLTEMIKDDVACLCSIFGNVDLLKQFNVTQSDALELPKACGAHANLSLCKNGTAAPGASPATPTTASNSSSPSESTTKDKNSANFVSYSRGMSYFAFFVVSFILSAH